MDNFPDYFAAVIVAVIILAIIRAVRDAVGAQALKIEVPATSVIDPEGLDFITLRIRRWVRRLFFSRPLRDYEFGHEYHEGSELRIRMFCPRTPLQLKIRYQHLAKPRVLAVNATRDNQIEQVPFWAHADRVTDNVVINMRVYLPGPIDNLAISVPLDGQQTEYSLEITVISKSDPDFAPLSMAFSALDAENSARAAELLQSYMVYCDTNPYAYAALARAHAADQNWTATQSCALRVIQYGLVEIGSRYYNYARCREGIPESPCHLSELRRMEEEWSVDPQIGLVALMDSEVYRLDLGRYHLRRQHHILLIRRAAAARMLNRVGFDYSPSMETILHSQVRIQRGNAEPIEVGEDKIALVDSASRNPAVTTDAEMRAVWILPELQTGDIVEWTADRLVRNRTVDDRPHPFALARVFYSDAPTVLGRVEFIFHDTTEHRFYETVQGALLREVRVDSDGLRHVIFSGQHYQSLRNLGFPFGELWMNPRIGITTDSTTWSAVAHSIRKSLLGKDWEMDSLPDELKSMADSKEDLADGLEAIFYWIRDRLKYGVFESAHLAIGSPDRAMKIIASGLADCKDRAYLLAQACRHLDVEWEFVLTSSELGSLIEELPADQSDHVLLRAKLQDSWLYMDPTGSTCVFGSVPYWYQGTKALVLDEQGTILKLPEDRPQENLIVIREVVSGIRDGWLSGSFYLHARGHSARALEELWKVMSLHHHDRLLASREALDPFFPNIRIERFDQLASTSESNTLKITGTCLRGSLTKLGSVEIGRVEWGTPAIPVREWRAFQFGRMFDFSYPMEIDLEIRFDGEVGPRLGSHSRLAQFEASGLLISEQIENGKEETTIRRRILVGNRSYTGEDVPSILPSFFEALESALELTVALDLDRAP